MLHTARAYNGMVVAPHRLAAEAGLRILRQGGNAVEAAVAAAATLCVVYPHMTGLGGDAFWLILPSGETTPLAIGACGKSAGLASREWYIEKGIPALPRRGPLAALTMAGAVSGWENALKLASEWPGQPFTLNDLFADAVSLAEEGFPVSSMQSLITGQYLAELSPVPGFAGQFTREGKAPGTGSRMRLPALAESFRRLAREGLDSFYRGSMAEDLAADLESAGSPLRLDDFAAHRALVQSPLALAFSGGTLFNCPPPTQGFSSLIILGLLERFIQTSGCDIRDEATLVHAIVEATKQAFLLRDRYLADPGHMRCEASEFLQKDRLDSLTQAISADKTLPWPQEETGQPGGDTVWFGVMDGRGNTVSCIQSIYHEFGSGLVLPKSGITWHNRGLGFSFAPGKANSLAPGKKPFHTLNPAMAVLSDGRIMSYGTMGGDGQPQTQAAVFARHILLGQPLQEAIRAPRWLLGRAWGDQSHSLKIEKSFPPRVEQKLMELGHVIEKVPAYSSLMGHAGALVRYAEGYDVPGMRGLLEGAADPRSDGSAACW